VHAGQEEHYRPTDVEFHRKEYSEKAKPFLRIESATPIETEKRIAKLKKQLEDREKEITTMKETIVEIQSMLEFVNSFNTPKDLKMVLDGLRNDYMTQLKENPRIEVDESIFKQIDDIATRKAITHKEALEQLVKDGWHAFRKGDARLKKMFREHGAPITRKDYEKHKRRREETNPKP
jgi:uncharacterized protein YeeX (DUF496 family)